MHDMHLHGFDLNLLRVLDALLRERHVTRAAKDLGLSQSALSHALARLRAALADPLLVKTSHGMQPTERALAMAGPLRRALEQFDQALAPSADFDPKTASNTFQLGVSDYEALVLMRPVLAKLTREAPLLNFRLRAPLTGEAPSLLIRGELDLVLKPLMKRDLIDGIYHRRLPFHERFVVVARQGNPYIQKKLTLKRYVEAPHVLITPGGTARGVVDDLLAQRGLSRRITVTLPHFLVAPHFVAETDLLLTLAERVALKFAPLLSLELHTLPLPLAGFTVSQLWHARTHADPAHRHLRHQIAELAGREGVNTAES